MCGLPDVLLQIKCVENLLKTHRRPIARIIDMEVKVASHLKGTSISDKCLGQGVGLLQKTAIPCSCYQLSVGDKQQQYADLKNLVYAT